MITAKKNGRVRQFNAKTWKLMPKGKYGWVESKPSAKPEPLKPEPKPAPKKKAAPKPKIKKKKE